MKNCFARTRMSIMQLQWRWAEVADCSNLWAAGQGSTCRWCHCQSRLFPFPCNFCAEEHWWAKSQPPPTSQKLTVVFFPPFLPFSSVQWSTSGSLFLTPLYHPTPFLSPGSPDFTLCHRQLGMCDHLQRCFCHQKPAGCEVLHRGTRQLPSTFGVRTAKKWGRYSLAEKLLTNSTAQWQLWKPFFKNNTVHPPYLHRLLPQPFPASASSLQRPKSFLAPRVIQIKLLCNQNRA